MMTIGGMIGNANDVERLRQPVMTHRNVRTGADFLKILVPYLTTREKNWLDSRLTEKTSAEHVIFEIDQELLDSYRSFYKEYPTYFEVTV